MKIKFKKKIGFTRTLNFRKNLVCGFTLIEMIVVVAIVAMISGLAIFNYGDFRSSISLENLSQDIALSVRQAQVYAISTKATSILSQAKFPGYGVHFTNNATASSPTSGSNKSFISFADVDGNGTYSNSSNKCDQNAVSPGNECLDVVSIISSDIISGFFYCTTNACHSSLASGALGTSAGNIPYTYGDTINSIDVVFNRPDPDAHFCVLIPGNNNCVSNVSNVGIYIHSVTDNTKTVTIGNTGQIAVQ